MALNIEKLWTWLATNYAPSPPAEGGIPFRDLISNFAAQPDVELSGVRAEAFATIMSARLLPSVFPKSEHPLINRKDKLFYIRKLKDEERDQLKSQPMPAGLQSKILKEVREEILGRKSAQSLLSLANQSVKSNAQTGSQINSDEKVATAKSISSLLSGKMSNSQSKADTPTQLPFVRGIPMQRSNSLTSLERRPKRSATMTHLTNEQKLKRCKTLPTSSVMKIAGTQFRTTSPYFGQFVTAPSSPAMSRGYASSITPIFTNMNTAQTHSSSSNGTEESQPELRKDINKLLQLEIANKAEISKLRNELKSVQLFLAQRLGYSPQGSANKVTEVVNLNSPEPAGNPKHMDSNSGDQSAVHSGRKCCSSDQIPQATSGKSNTKVQT